MSRNDAVQLMIRPILSHDNGTSAMNSRERRSRLLAFFCCLACLSSSPLLKSQTIVSSLAGRDTGEVSFVDLERAFRQWSSGKDLAKAHGWKWFKRWEAFNASRANPDGTLPGPSILWHEATRVRGNKTDAAKTASAEGWAPVGPTALADSQYIAYQPGLGRINCVAFHPTDPNTLWIGASQGGIWKSIDGGEHWTPLGDDLPILRISDISVDPNDPETIYIALGDYAYVGVDLVHTDRKRNTHYGMGVYKTTDGGATWSPTGLSFRLTDYDGSLIRRVFIDPGDSRRLVAAGTGGIWRSSDAGETWRHGSEAFIWDIDRSPANPDILYATTGFLYAFQTGSAGIIRSTDFGATWEHLDIAIPPKNAVQRIELAVSPSDPSTLYAVACDIDGAFYGFYRSTDSGTTWSATATAESGPNILGSFTGSQDQGDFYGQGAYDLTILVDPGNNDHVFVGGINIWATENAGSAWNCTGYWVDQFGPSVHADQHFLAWNPLNKRFYVCNDGGIYSTDSIISGSWDAVLAGEQYSWPTRWTNLTNGLNITSFYRLSVGRGATERVIAGAQDNSTYYFDGTSWAHTFGGDGMECIISPNNPKKIYGSAQFGSLMSSSDGGRTIRYDLAGPIIRDYNEQREWTAPLAMDPSNPDVLYLAFGNLWKSTGDDTLWSPISSFAPEQPAGFVPPATAMAISTADPNYIYIGKRVDYLSKIPSRLWMTSTGGSSWRDVTAGLPDSLYITYIATHGRDPGRAWAVFGGFVDGVKVYETTDAGMSWRNVSKNLPNVPVNCIVHDTMSTANTVYVGTDIGVYYTTDSLDRWYPFNLNLPNVIVSELEIGYDSRKLYAATFGRGIWAASLLPPTPLSVDGNGSGVRREMSVYPNPNRGRLTIELRNVRPHRPLSVTIIDITGRTIYRNRIVPEGDATQMPIDLDEAYGTYFAKVSDGSTSNVVRFVVDR